MIRSATSILFGLAALLAAPAQAAKSDFVRPTYAGAYQPQGTDERGLWMEIDEAERSIRDLPGVVKDEGLNAFVRSVLCRTVGDDRCAAARIYVVQDAELNAGMYPNGAMLVNTGLLVRLHSEAELATVLGHEFAHFEQRHTLKQFRSRRTGSDILAWVSLAGAAVNQNTGMIQNAIIGGFFSFDRAQETESDLLAANFIRSSPYRLRASAVWKRAIEERDALREERGLKRIRRLRPGLTETHPTNEQRFLYFSKLEAEAGDAGEDGLESYRTATAKVVQPVLAALTKGNEFGAADYIIKSRGDALGWDAPLLYARGELYRQRANPRDLATARGFFEQASTKPDAPAEAWRGLGLTAMRLGDAGAGKAALSEYMKRAPDALDAKSIKLLLEN